MIMVNANKLLTILFIFIYIVSTVLCTFLICRPDEQEILPYLKAMARIKDALEYLEQKKLKACDKVMGQMVR